MIHKMKEVAKINGRESINIDKVQAVKILSPDRDFVQVHVPARSQITQMTIIKPQSRCAVHAQ